MDIRQFQELPIIGEVLFGEPQGGRYAWAFVVITVGFSMYLSYQRGLKVGLLAGLPLVMMAIPQVLPEDRYLLAVAIRLLGVGSYIVLWLGILLFFPDAPTFFAGEW